MKLAIFLLTLVVTTGTAIALGIYAEFGVMKTTAFAICIWFVTQMAYVVFVGVLSGTSRASSRKRASNISGITARGSSTQED